MKEEWRDVVGYEGMYSVSNLGRVRSEARAVLKSDGYTQSIKERILKGVANNDGYLNVTLSKNGVLASAKIHSLVAVAFLGHVLDGGKGLLVDHINNKERSNNRVDNLQLTTTRHNSSKDKRNCSSQYTGVSFYKQTGKWKSHIHIDGKTRHLGYFHDEYQAHLAYQEALKQVI